MTYLLYRSSKFTMKILNPLVYLALLSFLFFFFFKSHRRKTISFQRFHWWDLPVPAKNVSKRLRQKVSPELIKGDKKGSGEGEGRWKLRGGEGLGPTYPENIFTLVKSTVRYTFFGCHTHTHAHTLADTHTFSFHAEAGTHTPKHTHTHTNPVWWNCQ